MRETSSVSTPSATTRSPRLWPRSMIECTIAAWAGCSSMSPTKPRSIFSSCQRQRRQVAERCLALAEVVEADLDAGGRQAAQLGRGTCRIGEDRRLGHLDDQPVGVQGDLPRTSITSLASSPRPIPRADTLTATLSSAPGSPSASQVGQRAAQHPPRQLVDEVGLLGQRQERVRVQQSARRMLPAHERLEAVVRPVARSRWG